MGLYSGKEILMPRCNGNYLAVRKSASEQLGPHTRRLLLVTSLCLSGFGGATSALGEIRTGMLLPDGREFVSWEQPFQFGKTYYVDNRNPRAADSNPGTAELPFLTINKAAQTLQPGERVLIMTGVYRERIDPVRGGT